MPVFPFEVMEQGCDDQHPAPDVKDADDQYVLRKGESLQYIRAFNDTEWCQQ